MIKKTFCDPITQESYILAHHPTGLQIYLMPRKEYSSSYAVFGTRYGSVDVSFKTDKGDIVVPEGIAHFLEHKLFESEDGDAFARFSATGANANAYTSFDRTCYLFSCTSRFEENLEILLDFVQSPYFTEKTVNKEQGIIGQEIRMYDDVPSWCVMFNMLQAMYKKHPVRVDIAGTVESISHITADLLYSCYNTFYNPSNMYICIAGNFDADKALEIIEKGIKSNDKKPVVKPSYYEEPNIVQSYIEKSLAVAMPVFSFGYKEDCKGLRSLKQRLSSEILLDIIASNTSPLFEKLMDAGLINDEFSFEYFMGQDFAVPMFQGESSDPKAVAKMISEEIERLKREGIDKLEFEISYKSAWAGAVARTEGNSSAVSAMIDCAMYGEGLFDQLKVLKELTVNDINEALSRIDTKAAVLSVINPNTKGE